jgi:uncharacterized protein
MTNPDLIAKTILLLKKNSTMPKADDWFHIERVYKMLFWFRKMKFVTPLLFNWVLLHDIADSKFHNGDETIGPR